MTITIDTYLSIADAVANGDHFACFETQTGADGRRFIEGANFYALKGAIYTKDGEYYCAPRAKEILVWLCRSARSQASEEIIAIEDANAPRVRYSRPGATYHTGQYLLPL